MNSVLLINALRLEQGVPWFGYDFGDKQIPHEAGLQDSPHQLYEGLLHRAGDCGTSALARTGEPVACRAEVRYAGTAAREYAIADGGKRVRVCDAKRVFPGEECIHRNGVCAQGEGDGGVGAGRGGRWCRYRVWVAEVK